MMDIGDDRHWRTGNYLSKTLSGFGFVARAAHDVAAGRSKGINLLQRTFNIGRLGDGH